MTAYEKDGAYYPQLETWGCNSGGLTPRWLLSLGGRDSLDVLGFCFGGAYLEEYYFFTEAMSITAGPLTGRKGKAKLADDIAISWVDTERKVYFILPVLNENRDCTALAEAKLIFNQAVNSSGAYTNYGRGGLLTSDFANEVLRLGKPSKQRDDHDQSFVTILQAYPYHMDNLNGDATSLDYGVIGLIRNYTYSDFNGDGGNGQMKVRYAKSETSKESEKTDFVMSSSTETISLLGDAGEYIHGFLKFQTAQANIAGNFDPRIKAAAEVMNTVMYLVTDKINETNTTANEKNS